MRKIVILELLVLLMIGSAPAGLYSAENQATQPWRIAYMNTLATNGEIINALKHTNIPELTGVRITDWKTFPSSPPINELAVSGGLDVVPEGVVPAASLLAQDPKRWRVVARLIYFPIVIMTRTDSGIHSLKDLRGKKVGTPFGSGAHPPIFEALELGGLTSKDITLINLGIPEQIEALRAKRVDAVGTWEPQAAAMKKEGLARALPIPSGNQSKDYFEHIAYILLRTDRIESCRSCSVDLLKAFILANAYAATKKDLVRDWFAKDSRFPSDLLASMIVIEPNMNAKGIVDVDITLKKSDIELGNRYAEFMFEHKLLPSKIDLTKLTDFKLALEAQNEIRKNPTILSAVKIVNP